MREKIKNFVCDHKEEIVVGIGTYIVYSIGFKAGRKAYYKSLQKTIKYLKDAGYVMVRVTEG